MFRKNYFIPVLFIGLFIIGSISVFAQTAAIGGTVQLKQAEGKMVPVDGAKIDCYRTDIKSGCLSTKTNKKGEFFILGIPFNAKVVLAVSGEGLSPIVSQEITPGNEKVSVDVSEGTGEVFTEERVREILEQSPTTTVTSSGELTKDQKAKQEEFEKETARIDAKNAKAVNNNKLRSDLLKEGNQAFKSKDWDVAIAKYEEGFNLDPAFIGGIVFLSNKAKAYKERAVDSYEVAVKTKDKKTLDKAKEGAVKDFTEALFAANKAYLMVKDTSAAEISPEKAKDDMKDSLSVIKSIFNLMGQINVNLATGLANEENAKVAVSVSRDSLKLLPDDPDILAGLAMALYTSSAFKGDRQELKESLSYWNQYKKIAPKDHKQQEVADEMIPFLQGEIK